MATLYNDTEYPYEFMGFTVYKDHSICNTCGARVESGIISKANHFVECNGKAFTDALKEEAAKGTLTTERVKELRKQHLK